LFALQLSGPRAKGENYIREGALELGMTIRVNAVVEIAGAPKEFVNKTMKQLIEHIEKNEKFRLLSKHRAKAKKHDELFSTFSELGLEFNKFSELLEFCFEYMPSNIEIEEPSKLELRREDMSDTMNELMLRLHKSDMSVKDANARVKLVEDSNRHLSKGIISLALKQGAKSPDELSSLLGIHTDRLTPIMDFLVEKKVVEFKAGKYSLR
jgi:hypothetical protein